MDLEYILDIDSGNGSSEELHGIAYLRAHLAVSVPYFVVLIVATITGTVGNFLIIASVCINKPLRTVGNVFICNLAIADLCVSSFVDIFNIISIVEGEPWFDERPGLCDFVGIVCLIACFCSLYSIGAVSFNRYIHICHHERYAELFTKRRTVMICVGLWVVSFLLELPNIAGWGNHSFDQKTLTCLWDRTASYSYVLFMAILGISLPLFSIAVWYWKIFQHVKKSKQRVAAVTENSSINGASRSKDKANASTRSRSQSMKLARTLFVIFVVFASCWTPYLLVIVADRHDTFPQEVHLYVIMIAHVNSSLNSILYGVTNKQFRDGYARVLGLHRCRGKKENSSTRESDGRTFDGRTVNDKSCIQNMGTTAMTTIGNITPQKA